MTWDDIRFFQPHEFDSPDVPGSGESRMNLSFVALLDEIRHAVGEPFVINSGYRTPAHNRAVGGVPNSAHMRGLAVDIKTHGEWRFLFKILAAAVVHGVDRIGISMRANIIHIDIDHSLPSPRIWFYP